MLRTERSVTQWRCDTLTDRSLSCMADDSPPVTPPAVSSSFETDRLTTFLNTVKAMAAGHLEARLPVSPRRDELDAIASSINALVSELGCAVARVEEADEKKAAELRANVADAEARNSAILKAIPDLMFVLRRDGTYVDYHVRDPKMLFVPPSAFVGRHVHDVLPPPLADLMMDALERACHTDGPVIVEYELSMDEPRWYEARIVHVEGDRLVSIVRDVTELKRASQLNRELARRLISSQEGERQRIARELHDDISQRIAALIIGIDQLRTQVHSERSRKNIQTLSTQGREIAVDLRRMSYELHPSKLQLVGLVGALQSLCTDVSKDCHLHVAFTPAELPASVDPTVSLCVYRIVQEALHNVSRHSRAASAQVSMTCEDGHIALQIVDSGVGFDPKHVTHPGLGLVSMRERVAALNGRLIIDAVPGRGTRIAVRLPLVSKPSGSQASDKRASLSRART